jgi:hypothetical protein
MYRSKGPRLRLRAVDPDEDRPLCSSADDRLSVITVGHAEHVYNVALLDELLCGIVPSAGGHVARARRETQASRDAQAGELLSFAGVQEPGMSDVHQRLSAALHALDDEVLGLHETIGADQAP